MNTPIIPARPLAYHRPVDRVRAGLFAAGGSLAAGGLGALGSRRAPEVYRRLEKPSWAPPAAAFGPVWTVLYVLVGVAGFRLARRGDRAAVALHGAQLVLNAAWPPVFFSRRSKRASLAVIAALDALVVAEVVVAARKDRVAATLLTPYLAWCLFATALNASVSEPGSTPQM